MNRNIPHYIGHRSRCREKYLREGLEGWHDYEILELLLFYAIRRKDTKPAAKKLLNRFKTLNGVFGADIRELQETEGISENSAVFLKLMRDISVRCNYENMKEKDLLNSPETVYEYLKSSLKSSADEEFKVLFLNTRNRLIETETLHTGTVNRSVIYPRKVVERGLYHHSAAVILAHNHPAGSLTPSPEDISATQSIKKALDTVEISLLDHVIIGGGGYFSFAENGIDF